MAGLKTWRKIGIKYVELFLVNVRRMCLPFVHPIGDQSNTISIAFKADKRLLKYLLLLIMDLTDVTVVALLT